MGTKLEELWQERHKNQKLSLNGTNIPGEGNGFHDRMSINVPYNTNPPSHRNEWLYSVYFRDLANLMNPQYKQSRDIFKAAIKFENCSENFIQTLQKYIGNSNLGSDKLLETFGHWIESLIYNGRVIIEFVSWKDNKSENFYAFELKKLDSRRCEIKDKYIVFHSLQSNEQEEIIKIPKEKCIIIEWPSRLGGFNAYQKTVNSILKLGNKNDSLTTYPSVSIKNSLKNMDDWDIRFHNLVSPWGTNKPLKKTTEFYKQENFFRLKNTTINCTMAVIDGLKQLVNILNLHLDEKAHVSFNYEKMNIEKYTKMKELWDNGKLSFKESNDFLKF